MKDRHSFQIDNDKNVKSFFMQKQKQKRTKRERNDENKIRTNLQVNFKSKCSCFILLYFWKRSQNMKFPLNMKLDVFSFIVRQIVHRDFQYAMTNGPQLKRSSCF